MSAITAASVFAVGISPQDPHSFVPIDDAGRRVEPNAHFDDWDPTPHAHFLVGVGLVQAGDVILGGTHQVEGFGRANQRGVDAIRFDLDYVVAPTMERSARLVVPIDQQLEIKRYTPGTPFRWAYVKAAGETRDAGLVPDYGSDSGRCLCERPDEDVNEDGFDTAATLCNRCVDSWEADYDVVRHFTEPA